MILEIIFIICACAILVFLARKLPSIIKLDFGKIKNIASVTNFKKKTHESILHNHKEDFFDKAFNANKLKESKEQIAPKKFSLFSQFGLQENSFSKADKLIAQGKLGEAEKIYLKIAVKDPHNVKVYNRLGVIYMEKNNFLDAKNAFAEAVKLDPKKASRHYNLAIACIELKEYRSALELLAKAVDLDGKNEKYKNDLLALRKKIKYPYKEMRRKED